MGQPDMPVSLDIPTKRWILSDGGALDVDICPPCWERQAHIQRYEFACQVLDHMRVLDFGCGVGYGTEMLALAGNTVIGTDSSTQALALAQDRRSASSIYSCPNVCEFRKPSEDLIYAGAWGACVAFEVIEHLDDPAAFVRLVDARHLIASVPVAPSVGINPHHKSDFTVESFYELIQTRFSITWQWIQVRPFRNSPAIAIVHGERL